MFFCPECQPELVIPKNSGPDGYSPVYCEAHAPKRQPRRPLTRRERLTGRRDKTGSAQ